MGTHLIVIMLMVGARAVVLYIQFIIYLRGAWWIKVIRFTWGRSPTLTYTVVSEGWKIETLAVSLGF